MKRILLVSIIALAIFLRFYQLGENPPSLYWDEASLGYNAYAIASTGMDEHGERFPLARFIAFGDYKPPGYIYFAALSVKIFALSEWSIRLPSAVAGAAMVVITYFVVTKLLASGKIGLLSAEFLAISPWSLQLSRAAFESHLAAAMNLAGVYFFFKGVRQRLFFPLSAIFFSFSFYTFNANRITAILLLGVLSFLWLRKKLVDKKSVLMLGIIFIILLTPSFSFLTSKEGKVRFQEVSIFTNLDIVRLANKRIAREATVLGKLVSNRRLLFAWEFIKHMLDHFDLRYLFISGDRNPRLSTQFVGEFYFFDFFLIIPGVFFIFNRDKRIGVVLLLWLIAALVPAATARETPHALRTASVLPVGQIFAAGGSMFWLKFIRKKKPWVCSIFTIIVVANIYYYLHYYFIHAPSHWSGEWQYGYKQMVEAVREKEKEYNAVVVTRRLGRPYIYFLLYNHVKPRDYLASRRAKRDWWGLWEVSGFAKYYFDVGYIGLVDKPALFVGIPGELPGEAKIIKRIYNPNGEEIFTIGAL